MLLPISLILILFCVISHAQEVNYCKDPCVRGDESIVRDKDPFTEVQDDLRWNVNWKLADTIANHNDYQAEEAGYYLKTSFLDDVSDLKEVSFFDSNSGKLLFVAPKGRTMEEFLEESKEHGWPSFRDDEVNWENVRVIPEKNGKVVSVDGTHLGHNNPDDKGSRYCIDLVSISGRPLLDDEESDWDEDIDEYDDEDEDIDIYDEEEEDDEDDEADEEEEDDDEDDSGDE